MYILLTDETNVKPDKNAKFFVYGGVFFPVEILFQLDSAIENIRHQFGYLPGDNLKFDTRKRPSQVTIQNSTEAKKQVIQVCAKFGCKFIVHIIHHEIIKNQNFDQQVQWAADFVIGRYNKYLKENNDWGICVMDNLPSKTQFKYLSDKFSYGLKLYDGRTVKLDKIKLYASTCINASHSNSAIDIILGCFRYCINDPKNINVAKNMLKSVVQLMWYKKINNTLYLRDRGLIIRPKLEDITSTYKSDYNDLLRHLKNLL